MQGVQNFTDAKFNFIKSFKYDLGNSDLVPFGAAQYVTRYFTGCHLTSVYRSFDAGQEAFARYSKLVSKNNLPFIRADGSDRVVDSATNWTAGFASASHNTVQPKLNLILPQTVRACPRCAC